MSVKDRWLIQVLVRLVYFSFIIFSNSIIYLFIILFACVNILIF